MLGLLRRIIQHSSRFMARMSLHTGRAEKPVKKSLHSIAKNNNNQFSNPFVCLKAGLSDTFDQTTKHTFSNDQMNTFRKLSNSKSTCMPLDKEVDGHFQEHIEFHQVGQPGEEVAILVLAEAVI